jgi:steroid delta-isomerase-like uncharacterized protein
MSVSAEENAALATRIYDLWNARDLEAALGLATEDIDITLVAYGLNLTGRDGFRQFMERFATAFPDMKKEITNQIASEDQVVCEFRLKGTHDGPLRTPTGEVPPAGRTVELSVIEVMQVRDGKVAAIRNYTDTATLMRQLGRSE